MTELAQPAPTRVVFTRHPDDEWYDAVGVIVVPRWKESELSGDEWRFSYVVQFCRKGHVLIERSFSRLEWALAHVPSIPLGDLSYGADDEHQGIGKVLSLDHGNFCAQPGCGGSATREFRIVKLYNRQGDEIAKSHETDHRFRFCSRHASPRGDCGLLDSDANLVEVRFGSEPDAPALGGD